jgi:hypothetical protein
MKTSEKKELQLQLNETQLAFSVIIDDYVTNKRCSYIEAILLYCKEHEVEPEHIPGMVSKTLKAKIEEEAGKANLIKKKFRLAELPI